MYGVICLIYGYFLFKKDYIIVFIVLGCGIKKGVVIDKMNFIDEVLIIVKILGLEFKNVDGRIVEEFLE